ncbi:type II toxin-antitoxin system Phd/YefM family antitoxin [Sphingomonas psychrolutea]|uniref:Antitoxin n=1 Tax=Sphingomonas psychrolutea TaxID=1259676 RepID=A0ABQ1H362_9SPHN|nr:type II toxin-antitoxin system prevent-host-death family antitoxin [Sphingomonas psychrolutea]GGA57196.1 antitoxin [Sphingomonas psychrolutea]
MDRISISEARTHLCAIIRHVEAGESVEITRRGKVVVVIRPVDRPKQPVDVAAPDALTADMTIQTVSAGHLIRQMRDTHRY